MVLRLATRAMGTRFELVLAGDEGPRLRAAGEEALREVEEAERRLSLFRRDSQVARLNRGAGLGAVRLDPDTFELLELAAEVHRASAGAFDPTVAPLLRALGLHGGDSSAPHCDEERARQALGWDAVELDPARRSARFTRPGIALDLGGIAKGHALDLAAAVLLECGVSRALLHGGTSTVVALGAPEGSPCWRVSIGSGPDPHVAELCDAALSVSAPSGRVARRGDRSLTHVIDPHTAAPAAGVALAAVIAPRAAVADAWSTALLAAGSPRAARRAGLETLHSTTAGAQPLWIHHAPGAARFSRVPTPKTPTPTLP